MKQLTNRRLHERGAAHFVALFLFVALVGVVGFVGYNAWQKQQTNAGGQNTVGNVALQKELTAAQTKLDKALTDEKTAQTAMDKKRANERSEDKAIDDLYNKRKNAGDNIPVRQQKLNEAQAELNRLVNNRAKAAKITAQQAVVNDWAAKLATSQANYNAYNAQIQAIRDTWPQTAKLKAAKANVESAKQVVATIKGKIAAQGDGAKKDNKDNGKKQPAPKHKTAYCNSPYKLNSTKTACYKEATYVPGAGAVVTTCPEGASQDPTPGHVGKCRKQVLVSTADGKTWQWVEVKPTKVESVGSCKTGYKWDRTRKLCVGGTQTTAVLYK